MNWYTRMDRDCLLLGVFAGPSSFLHISGNISACFPAWVWRNWGSTHSSLRTSASDGFLSYVPLRVSVFAVPPARHGGARAHLGLASRAMCEAHGCCPYCRPAHHIPEEVSVSLHCLFDILTHLAGKSCFCGLWCHVALHFLPSYSDAEIRHTTNTSQTHAIQTVLISTWVFQTYNLLETLSDVLCFLLLYNTNLNGPA